MPENLGLINKFEVTFLWNTCHGIGFLDGQLMIDHHSINFFSNQEIFDFRAKLHSIDDVERKSASNLFNERFNDEIEIFFKDFRRWKFIITDDSKIPSIIYSIQKRLAIFDEKCPYPFFFKLPFDIEINGWEIYQPTAEFIRIFKDVPQKYRWKLIDDNKDFNLCSSYPPLLVIPGSYDPEELAKIKPFRDGNRFPVFSWIHPNTLATICRTSQPLHGRFASKRCEADEKLVHSMFFGNPNAPKYGGYIIDARPFSSAMANRAKGAGFERAEFYGDCRIEFLGIENIHAIRESFQKLKKCIQTCSSWLTHIPFTDKTKKIVSTNANNSLNSFSSIPPWTEKLVDSKWLHHLQILLNGSILVADLVHHHRVSVLVHCTHGWDRTTQVISLSQIMLDPFYRTINGFIILIEKEWVSLGHKFADRCNKNKTASMNAREESPIFLQFLDTIYQLTRQFPTEFEFNELFLIKIIECLYSLEFGTFLYNNEGDKTHNKVTLNTVSLWSFLLHPSKFPDFVNPLYSPEFKTNVHYLRPSISLNRIVLWEGLYLRAENYPSLEARLIEKIAQMKIQTEKFEKRDLIIKKLKEKLTELNVDPSEVLNELENESNSNIVEHNPQLTKVKQEELHGFHPLS